MRLSNRPLWSPADDRDNQVVGAQQAAGEPVSFFNDSIDGGSISMTGVRIG